MSTEKKVSPAAEVRINPEEMIEKEKWKLLGKYPTKQGMLGILAKGIERITFCTKTNVIIERKNAA